MLEMAKTVKAMRRAINELIADGRITFSDPNPARVSILMDVLLEQCG